MQIASRESEPQFSQPSGQILTMLVVIALVGTGAWLAHEPILEVILSNIYLNGVIVAVFVIGVVACFWQVFSLISSVSWIEGFAMDRAGHEFVNPPRLLVSLATLLKSRGARMQISASSSRSILDSMATRLDEAREITRYIINLLIFLGLLGTFYGLATTVPAVVDTIRSLAPSADEGGVEVFGRLMTGLEKQLGGMGTAFSSSLLGLAGSLVVGLLDLFTGHGQNRFYRELEEWLSTITSVSLSAIDGEGGPGGLSYDSSGTDIALHRMAESVEELHKTFIRAEDTQSETAERIAQLTRALTEFGTKMAEGRSSEASEKALSDQLLQLTRIADGQDKLAKFIAAQEEESLHAFLNFTLTNMNRQLLRINEEVADSRLDMTEVMRQTSEAVRKEISKLGRKPPVQPGGRG
ncbi:MAG: biopolymer transporter ExbB [Rhodobacteraceae bacterium]|nr:biopolymer transporter ExbB [Paracoccaceae bacterium]